jgi:hypothetical protein
MYTLNSITAHIVYSANGNLALTKTVVNTIAALGARRNVMTADDIAYIINRKVYSDEQVTVKQVAAVMNEVARSSARGERYHGLKSLTAQQFGFYGYGK